MSSLSVSHYQSLDSHERKSIMWSHKVNLVIIISSLNCDVQVGPRSLFSPHRRVTRPRTKLFIPPIKARIKPWLRKPIGWRRRSDFLLEPDIIYEGFEPIRHKTKQSQARTVFEEAEQEIILPQKKEKLEKMIARRTDQTVNTGRQTPPPHVGVVTLTDSNIVRSYENSTTKNRQDERSQRENNDLNLNNYGELISWESRRL